jgi:hypothetical protein
LNPITDNRQVAVLPRGLLLWLISIGLPGLLAFAIGTHWQAWTERPVFHAAAADDCDLARAPCTARFLDGASIRLAFDADRLTPLHPLATLATVGGIDANDVGIEISGVDMNMGLVTQQLTGAGNNAFSGSITLPVCVRGQMRWRAHVAAHTSNAVYRANFLFDTGR